MSKQRSTGRRAELGVRIYEVPLLIGLVLTWTMLWDEFSLLSVLSGLVVSVIVMRTFYLPPVELAGRFNMWWVVRYLAYFFWNLTRASWQVAWLAVRPGPTPPVSIISVKLHTRSDFILTMVALTNSLIPGSLVAEVDRFASTLYLHVLDTPTERQIRQMREDVYEVERLLIRAIGSHEEVEMVK